jgi:hypothetical protein
MSKKNEISEIFGDKKKFAVEASLIQNTDDVFINFCYWINGLKIGDNTSSSLLRSLMEEIKLIVNNCGQRYLFDIQDLSNSKSVINDLINILWGEQEIKTEIKNIPITEIKKIEVNPVCECFDGYHVFLIEQAGFDLLLAKDIFSGKIVERKLSKKIFKKTISDFYFWLINYTNLVLTTYFNSLLNSNTPDLARVNI